MIYMRHVTLEVSSKMFGFTLVEDLTSVFLSQSCIFREFFYLAVTMILVTSNRCLLLLVVLLLFLTFSAYIFI